MFYGLSDATRALVDYVIMWAALMKCAGVTPARESKSLLCASLVEHGNDFRPSEKFG
jgi:hypothetical protein